MSGVNLTIVNLKPVDPSSGLSHPPVVASITPAVSQSLTETSAAPNSQPIDNASTTTTSLNVPSGVTGSNPVELPGTVQSSKPQSVQQLQKQESDVGGAIKKLNDYVQSSQRDLHFSVDKATGKTVIKVIDQKTQKVVRQIPEELLLKLAQDLQQEEPISLFKAKA